MLSPRDERATAPALDLPTPAVAGLFWILLGSVVIAYSVDILPARYFLDHFKLLEAIHSPHTPTVRSFEQTAALYRLIYPLGVPDRVVVGILNYTAVVVLLIICMLRAPNTRRVRDYAWLTSWCLLASLYVGMLSKEVFTIALAALVVILISKPTLGRALSALAAIALYGLGVRQYWLAVPLYAMAIYWVVLPRPSLPKQILAFVAVLGSASLAVRIGTGLYLTDARIVMNIVRLESPDVASMVLNPLPNTSIITDVANHIWAWVNFLVPVRLLRSGVTQQIAFAVWQVTNMLLVVAALRRARGGLPREAWMAIVSFTVAVTIVLAAFDGDFGTYNRHQITLLPILGFVCGIPLPAPRRNEQ
jgi:hypothetical protein